MERVVAIVVTYNRKHLLKENLECLQKQNADNLDILIIDNCSTDGTEDYIKDYIGQENVYYIKMEKNLGGAGGFNIGIKEAYKRGYDYFWIMDDDTMPKEDCLQQLLKADEILKGNYGFLCSYVKWTDGTYCVINGPHISNNWMEKVDLLDDGLLAVESASFVSIFIPAKAVRECGLPVKEFFIWGDDVEYTERLAQKYPCYLCKKSEVIHKMGSNCNTNIVIDSKERLNRYQYMFRNRFFIAKKKGTVAVLKYCFWILKQLKGAFIHAENYRFRRCRIILKGMLKGIVFSPKIEKAED